MTTMPSGHRPHVIVFGNEKGGSGKSTAAMHVIVGLLRSGWKVGAIDLDLRQGTLSRYFERRKERMESTGQDLPCPTYIGIPRSDSMVPEEALAAEKWAFEDAFASLAATHDVIVIDTPGSDNYLSRLGHSYADTLVTPINDSFVDLDLLATVDPDSLKIVKPSVYSEMVWEQRKNKMQRDKSKIDWIVMRNRLSHLDARNKREISDILDVLEKRIAFRMAPGFGERVIYRELFLKGMTMLDVIEAADAGASGLSMSHIAARQEVRQLLDTIGVDAILKAKAAAA